MNKKHFTTIAAWCLYDWAVATFPVIVTTFIFATYFTASVAADKITGTYQWANAAALSGVIIALTGPLFGAIADHGGRHKRWLLIFTLLCVISSALLWFAYPTPRSVDFTLTCVVVGTVAFEVALVFYNAFLPHIVTKGYLGRVSGWGWGSGYLGGIVALSVVLFVFIKSTWSWLDTTSAEQIRICGPFVAIWMFVFSLPLFFCVPDISTVKRPFTSAMRLGWRELVHTLRRLPRERNIFLYLISHMIYTDGLNTLFAFGGIYAAGTIGLSFEEVLLFGITMNITAGLGAIALGWMDDGLGSKKTIILSIISLIALGIVVLLTQQKYVFWAACLFLCIFVGPVQSSSRTLMVRIMDKEVSAEMFGLYALSGKITAFMGPWLLGVVTLWFNSQRAGLATVLVFFVVGGLLLLPVKEKATKDSRR